MKFLIKAAAPAMLLALGACGGGADDKAAANVEAAGDNVGDALDAQADNAQNGQVEDQLHDQADAVRDNAHDQADQIDDKDDARLENQAMNQM
jgi:hypothetical protein